MVGVVLLGVLLMWMYRRGKKAATAGHVNNEVKQKQEESLVGNWAGGEHTAPPVFETSHRLEVADDVSRDDYSGLHSTPVYSEIGGAQRSELHSDSATKAELPPDAEVRRAGGRRW